MFITIEGAEGSGKTTQISHMVEFLQQKGEKCVTTREPGGTSIGKTIRAILLDPANKTLDPLAELLLYAADRAQHVRSVIIPGLSAGKTVVCDRFSDSTVVYQGFARGLDMTSIQDLNKIVLDGLKPDITFILDLDPEIGLLRAQKQLEKGSRNNREARFELEALSFHKKIRAGFLELARLEPERFQVVDASKSELQVKNELLNILSTHYEKKI